MRVRELVKQLGVIFETANWIGQQSAEPSGIFSLNLGDIAHAHLEILPIRVHGADHYLVTQNKFQVYAIGRHLNHAVSAGDAGEDENTVFPEGLHAVEDHAGISGCLENQVERTKLLCAFGDRDSLRNQITRSDRFDKLGIESGFLSVPSTPTRNTLTSTPRPFGTSSTEGRFRSARCTLFGLPENTLIAFIGLSPFEIGFCFC